jgi:hypothetical protein
MRVAGLKAGNRSLVFANFYLFCFFARVLGYFFCSKSYSKELLRIPKAPDQKFLSTSSGQAKQTT